MSNKSSRFPFKIETNVEAKVINSKREVKQVVNIHNKATSAMTEGIVRFLRGEFTDSFIAGHLPTIGDNFNIADPYIPSFMGIGCAGVSADTDTFSINYVKSMYPGYNDTRLYREMTLAENPGRVVLNKSVKSDAILSNAYTLTVSARYQFDNLAYTGIADTVVIPKGEYHEGDVISPLTTEFNHIGAVVIAESSLEEDPLWYIDPNTNWINYRKLKHDTDDVAKIDLENNRLIFTKSTTEILTDTSLELLVYPDAFYFCDLESDNSVSSNGAPYIEEDNIRTYCITEFGLFSGDISNPDAKLLARVLLDSESPIKVVSGDYIIINWQIGVYSIDDNLRSTSNATSTYKYTKPDYSIDTEIHYLDNGIESDTSEEAPTYADFINSFVNNLLNTPEYSEEVSDIIESNKDLFIDDLKIFIKEYTSDGTFGTGDYEKLYTLDDGHQYEILYVTPRVVQDSEVELPQLVEMTTSDTYQSIANTLRLKQYPIVPDTAYIEFELAIPSNLITRISLSFLDSVGNGIAVASGADFGIDLELSLNYNSGKITVISGNIPEDSVFNYTYYTYEQE